MATAPAKKKSAPNPLDDLDDAGLEALPTGPAGATASDGMEGLEGSPTPQPEEVQPAAPPAPMLRLALRAACGLLILASVAVYFLNPAAPMTAAKFDAGTTVIVSLVQGGSYGQAIVHLGDGAVGEPLLDDESLKHAIAGAAADASKTRLLIKASGGVQQREVDRVGRLVLEAVGPERKIEIHVAPLESSP